jgi:hypothetical protein
MHRGNKYKLYCVHLKWKCLRKRKKMEKFEGIDHFGDLGIAVRIILKFILEK